ncbi:restriction endonuclease subunit S [Vibrio harveyi]|uniref:restriction endonuclease subunit S n=1 Tax=Vibrio harveyi TaxID=669 RepID=UPI00069E4C0F|nr:restriction endonuclease subunit S [Vibrio harveyi]
MSELPKGWVETNFEEVSDYIQRGKGPKYTEYSEYPVVNQKAVRWFGLQEEHLKYVHPEQWDKWDEQRYIREGDILWNSTGTGTIGRACHIDRIQLAKAKVVDSHVTIVRTSELIDSKFAFYWIKHPEIQNNINGLYNGSTNQVELSKKIVQSTRIPLAPLAEQKRIVEKLDEVLAQVDTIKARLDGIPALLKRFRQSVLASAVSGKLTEDSNADWVGCHLSDVSTFQNGYAFKSGWFSDEGDYQVIKLGNVKDDFLKLDAAPAYLSSKLGLEHIKFKPEIGDILLSMTGTKFKRDYGFCCMVDRELPILINQRVGRIIPKRDKVMPDFLHLFLRSEVFRNQFFAGETGGVNQGNVGSKHIMAIQLSVPDLELQIEIAKKARLLFTFADTIEAQVKKAQARVDNLTQSILAKAFRGELVPQDPNDEPADKLLERIAQARKEAEALAKAAKKAQSTKNTAKKKVAKSA